MFGEGINWLVANMHKYDACDWSYYNQECNQARDSFHKVNIIQQGRLYGKTGGPVLKKCSDLFDIYAN